VGLLGSSGPTGAGLERGGGRIWDLHRLGILDGAAGKSPSRREAKRGVGEKRGRKGQRGGGVGG